MATTPSITVVIPAHNVGLWLAEQLDALSRQDFTGPWRVVLVDNRSTDDTRDVAESFSGRLTLEVLDADEFPSASYARNVGIRATTSDWIVFVDGDDVADTRLLSAFAERMEDAALLGGHLDDLALNAVHVAEWRYSVTAGKLPVAFGLVPFVLTSNCAVRRDVFDDVGFFDDSIVVGGEDVDFSIRAWLAGLTPVFVPTAVVHYRHRPTLGALAEQQWRYGRNNVRLYETYRDRLGLERTSARQSAALLWKVLGHSPNLVRGTVPRGQWVRHSGFVAGEVYESVRRRRWHVG